MLLGHGLLPLNHFVALPLQAIHCKLLGKCNSKILDLPLDY